MGSNKTAKDSTVGINNGRRHFFRASATVMGTSALGVVPDPLRSAVWAQGSDAPELTDCAACHYRGGNGIRPSIRHQDHPFQGALLDGDPRQDPDRSCATASLAPRAAASAPPFSPTGRPGKACSFSCRNPRISVPPPNPDAPLIMVGPGTGIAPFRAFLQERQAAGANGKNWLFFGEQHAETDFYYRDELTAMQHGRHPAPPGYGVLARSAEKNLRATPHAGTWRRTMAMTGAGRAFLRLRQCQPHGARRGCRGQADRADARPHERRSGSAICSQNGAGQALCAGCVLRTS